MGDERDLFWNRDHVELIGRRLGLDRVRCVLDVGCGVGHWGRLLDATTAPDATVTGVDMEPEWVAEATRRAEAAGLADRFTYRQGRAEALPFPDATFDLVTCQTVLIHVPDPAAVVAEMTRVAKPGGLVVAAEPNNRAGLVVEMAPADDLSPDALAERVRFAVTCERGKAALGEGDNSIGDRVPGLFARAGLQDVRTWLADRTWPLVPPYATPDEQAVRDLLLTEAQRGTWGGWSRAEAARLHAAGGGEPAAFAAAWERRRAEVTAVARALEAGTLETAGASVHYLVAGRRSTS
jgi:SAM-dependent methyltransferase